jgi:murein DD-endopeptidase MepM/ murein hydrolase activator NlpD
VVVTGAFLGAGVVAMGAASAFPGPSDSGPTTTTASGAFTIADLAARQAVADRANRATDRVDAAATDALDTGVWLTPLRGYTFGSPFGATAAHPGVTLSAQEGAPFVAAHSGKVVLARYSGGLGYTIVIDAGNGTTITYGHSSRLLVKEGQHVEAGDVIGLIGDSGYSFGSSLYYEVERSGKAVDTAAFMLTKGIDLSKANDS